MADDMSISLFKFTWLAPKNTLWMSARNRHLTYKKAQLMQR